MADAATIYRNELKAGDFAPDFTLDTDSGEAVTLSELKGQHVVLYFYPKDDTPGCTIEAQQFSAKADAFEMEDAVVIGISKDNIAKHCKFRDKYDLKVRLASDEEGTVCEAYDCWVEKSMYGKKYMGIERNTFLINAQGKIARIWKKVKPEGHADEVLAAVKAL